MKTEPNIALWSILSENWLLNLKYKTYHRLKILHKKNTMMLPHTRLWLFYTYKISQNNKYTCLISIFYQCRSLEIINTCVVQSDLEDNNFFEVFELNVLIFRCRKTVRKNKIWEVKYVNSFVVYLFYSSMYSLQIRTYFFIKSIHKLKNHCLFL